MPWVSWRWEVHLPRTDFKPKAVKDPSRDNVRLDKASISVPFAFPFLLVVYGGVHNRGAGHSCPPCLFPVLPAQPCDTAWESLLCPISSSSLWSPSKPSFCHPQGLVLVLPHWRAVLASLIVPWREDSSNGWRSERGLSIIPSHAWKASFWAKYSSKRKNCILDFTALSQLHKGVWG